MKGIFYEKTFPLKEIDTQIDRNGLETLDNCFESFQIQPSNQSGPLQLPMRKGLFYYNIEPAPLLQANIATLLDGSDG